MADLSSRIADLSPEKKALLAQMLKKRAAGQKKQPVPRRDDPSGYPLSFAQQRLWFLDQLEPDSPFYIIPGAIRLAGALDLGVLEACLNAIVRRHEVLRACFTTVNGEPVQKIDPDFNLKLDVVDLRGQEREQQEAEVARRAVEDAHKPFRLTEDALIRAQLIQLNENESVMLLAMHHIVSDGWSLGVFINEISALYPALLAGQPSPLLDLQIQYFDYAEWQRRWLKEGALEEQLTFWKKQLEGCPTVLELPTSHPRPSIQTFQGGRVFFSLPNELAQALHSLSRAENTTLFTTLLAAFQTMLFRYSGQEDFCVGTPSANRNRQEIEGLIGFFVNTLVIRSDFSSQPSFLDLLRQVRGRVLEAQANADLPFEMLIDALQIQRDMAISPLFQVVFTLQDAITNPIRIPGIQSTILQVENRTAKFDLTLVMEESGDGLGGWFEFNTDLFNRDMIERMAGHFEILLRGVAADPRQPVTHLPLLTAAERQTLLVDWNATEHEYPTGLCLHQLFEQQAEKTPNAVALVFDGKRMTYGELNRRSNQLAGWLRKQGVQPDELVGVFVDRSFEMMVAIFGILKSGAGYLPIDTTYPPDRVDFMLEDANVSIVLTQEKHLSQLSEFSVRAVAIDTGWDAVAQEPDENLPCAAAPHNIAYVIYTSGSTGKPKGTLIEHASAVNFVFNYFDIMGLDSSFRYLQFFSNCFDGSVADFFGVLSSGGSLYIITKDLLLSVKELTRFIQDNEINATLFPPSMLSVLKPEELPGFIHLGCGGEKMPPDLAAAWAPGRQLVNVYGPTEATVMQVIYKFGQDWDPAVPVPIGKVVPNHKAYVLDRNLQPVPVGIPGELHLSGTGLARGYLNRPELTAERFIQDPFSSQPGARLYKTGDLVRYRPDGNIEYLGRTDNQVKVRGFRIELGEIENVLRSHEQVAEAAVLARQDVPGSTVLVAYIVTEEGSELTVQSLRGFLADLLPDYMVPSMFVFLKEMPLTASGRKIDRKALPAPDLSAMEQSRELIVPRTGLEEYLAEKWKDIVHASRVSVQDNFFELGGNSLQAAVFVNRVQEETGEPLLVRSVFLAPTLAGLAEYIHQHHPRLAARFDHSVDQAQPVADLPPIVPGSGREELPLSFAQQRLWFLDQLEPDSPFYNVSAAVRLTGKLDTAAFKAAFNEILRRHDVLRTCFSSAEGKAVQQFVEIDTFDIPVVDFQELNEVEREDEVKRITASEARRPFNLSAAPLIRVALLKLNPEEHVAVLTMHHIVSDGWSMGVLIRELAVLYPAFAAGQASPLPALPVQYADYAAWQRSLLDSNSLQGQMEYWLNKLADIPPLLELPTDSPRPAVQTYQGEMVDFELPREASRKLIEMGRRLGATPFMALLAVFQALLARYSGQDDIPVGTPVANRIRHEIEGLIGFFVNTLVLRADLGGEPDFKTLLERVKTTVLEASANQDLPFEILVDKLHPERNLSQSPLFQVMFSFENDQLAGFDLPGLSLSLIPMDTGTSKFDITLNIVEGPEGYHGQIEYNTDLFRRETIQRMAAHYCRLIEGVSQDSSKPIAQLPMLSNEEYQQVVYGWNQTRVEYNLNRTVPQLFEDQARRSPDQAAVIYKNQSLTYVELDRRANQLAGYLQKLGAGPEVVIGLCVERSLEMIIGLLGILKSGAAYLPLDPVYPTDRLAFMLSDSRAKVVLTQQRLDSNLPAEVQKIYLDSEWARIAEESDSHSLPANPAPENAAYIIYTSGSTGTPKGVLVEHRSMVNHNQATARAFDLTPTDRVLQFATINFDTAIEEIFPALISGATLVLRPEQELSTAEQLMALIREERLTVLDLPTAYWHEWVREISTNKLALPASLRLVVVGGEKALPERYEQWLQIAGDRVTWLNTYGPTEGTIIATIYRPPLGQPLPEGRLPIGRPIDNDRIYLLDAHRSPVPVGLPGELYIAGAGVARGYLNRPDLTAEKFLPDPFVPGERMYRSGDLARFLPDGSIEFTGRADHQVKVRGFRIEPGEIEGRLRSHPAVAEAVVMAREDTPGVRRLAAYIVSKDGANSNSAELRGFLKEQLPEYMIPAVFVSLDKLPLTPSGKVDRKALPAPDDSRPDLENQYEAPTTENEKILAEIWSQVLGLKQIGIHDNFFELGGDSILSIQVIARANAAGLHLTPRNLFEAQTIAQLAALASIQAERQIPQGPVTGPVGLTPIQRWFFEQKNTEPDYWNQSILLETTQPLERGAMETALNALFEHHDMLRARFTGDETGWKQTIAEGHAPASVEWIDLSRIPTSELPAAIELACVQIKASLSLAKGPLLRVACFDLGPNHPGRFFMTVHHLVIDGVSWRIMLEDLQTAYGQALAGQPVMLPAKTSSFQDWSTKLAEYAQSSQAASELEQWLAEPGFGLSFLPVDFPGGDEQEAYVHTYSHALSAEDTGALLKDIPAAFHAEVQEELLAALGLALHQWSGRQSFLVELEGHGREDVVKDVDLTRTVGWFTTIYPFRIDHHPGCEPAETLKQVKEHLRRLPQHGIGYSLLRYLSPDARVKEKIARLPQAQISFNYLGKVSADMQSSPIFRFARESTGPEHSPKSRLSHLLTVSALVREDRLVLEWTYSQNIYRPTTIQALAEQFEAAVKQLRAQCAAPTEQYSASDFSDVDLGEDDLENLLGEIGSEL